jgi:hypothetical protein
MYVAHGLLLIAIVTEVADRTEGRRCDGSHAHLSDDGAWRLRHRGRTN